MSDGNTIVRVAFRVTDLTLCDAQAVGSEVARQHGSADDLPIHMSPISPPDPRALSDVNAGVRAVFGFPLAMGDLSRGARNLYRNRPGDDAVSTSRDAVGPHRRRNCRQSGRRLRRCRPPDDVVRLLCRGARRLRGRDHAGGSGRPIAGHVCVRQPNHHRAGERRDRGTRPGRRRSGLRPASVVRSNQTAGASPRSPTRSSRAPFGSRSYTSRSWPLSTEE